MCVGSLNDYTITRLIQCRHWIFNEKKISEMNYNFFFESEISSTATEYVNFLWLLVFVISQPKMIKFNINTLTENWKQQLTLLLSIHMIKFVLFLPPPLT